MALDGSGDIQQGAMPPGIADNLAELAVGTDNDEISTLSAISGNNFLRGHQRLLPLCYSVGDASDFDDLTPPVGLFVGSMAIATLTLLVGNAHQQPLQHR